MKKYTFLISALFSLSFAYSQMGIGTVQPQTGALLELDATIVKGGLLLPRVELYSTTVSGPLTEHVQGMVLYNTRIIAGINGVSPGFYYNDGSKWIKLESKDNSHVWSTEGNSGTNSSTHFIGTTDRQSLFFKANNQRVAYLGRGYGDGTFLGLNAGNPITRGEYNTAVGENVLSKNTTGELNTATGANALRYNGTGNENSANGFQSMLANTTGNYNAVSGALALSNNNKDYNTVSGYRTMFSQTNGEYNTVIGTEALFANAKGNGDGSRNTVDGYRAISYTDHATWHTVMGFEAMHRLQNSLTNTAIGSDAMHELKSGNGNVAVGGLASFNIVTLYYNTILGYMAGSMSENLFNSTVIGAWANVNASDKVRIGDTTVTSIEGQVPFTTPSDARFKSNVQQNVPGLAFINQLQPVTYYFDNQKMAQQLNKSATDYNTHATATQKIQTGFLAQDVEKAAQALNYDFDGVIAPKNENDYYTLSYSQFVVPLVQAVKEQQEMILAQELKTDNLDSALQKHQMMIEDIQNKMTALEAKIDL
ncbi:MAG TPA: tail fiber domain-containing protein [Moheibacter sp.]|nr:tail fiber domain-containing protein [Moheibacter sp.]